MIVPKLFPLLWMLKHLRARTWLLCSIWKQSFEHSVQEAQVQQPRFGKTGRWCGLSECIRVLLLLQLCFKNTAGNRGTHWVLPIWSSFVEGIYFIPVQNWAVIHSVTGHQCRGILLATCLTWLRKEFFIEVYICNFEKNPWNILKSLLFIFMFAYVSLSIRYICTLGGQKRLLG